MSTFTDPEDPIRLAQLHERIRVLEAQVDELKRTLPAIRANKLATAAAAVPPAPASASSAPTPATTEAEQTPDEAPVPARFEPNYDTMTSAFSEMGLKPALLSALQANGFMNPTPMQTAALVPMIQGNTMLIQSPAGGGRTISFALAALQAVDPTSKHVQVLVLASSKERASQIAHDIRALSGGIWDTAASEDMNDERSYIYCCVSGTKTDDDRSALASRPNIVIGTPGRVFHMLDRNHLRVSHLSLLLADECDDLLTTFLPLVTRILKSLPAPAAIRGRGLQTVWAADQFKGTKMLSNALQFAPDSTRVSMRVKDGVWRVVKARPEAK